MPARCGIDTLDAHHRATELRAATLSRGGVIVYASRFTASAADEVADTFHQVVDEFHLTDVSPVIHARTAEPVGDGEVRPLLIRTMHDPVSVDGHQAVDDDVLRVVTYLADHDGNATDDTIIDALSSGRWTRSHLWELIASARVSFGSDVVPDVEGSLTVTLSNAIATDIGWCQRLLTAALADETRADVLLDDALELIVGAPYRDRRFDWVDLDGTLTLAVATIEAVCVTAARRALDAADIERARAVVAHGLAVLEVNEPLTQLAMRIEHAAGAGMTEVWSLFDRHVDALTTAAGAPGSIAAGATTALLDPPTHGDRPPTVLFTDPSPAHRRPMDEDTPRVILRCFGGIAIDGAVISQAMATPFVVAAAGGPVTIAELAAIAGYNPRTVSTMWTTTNGVLDRCNSDLTVASGVWTDFAWYDELTRRAAATIDHDPTAGARSLDMVLAELHRIDSGAYAHCPGKPAYWRWVDEYPGDVTARADAEQHLTATALDAIGLRDAHRAVSTVPPEHVVACRLALHVPTARVDGYSSSAEALLITGRHAAGDRADLIAHCRATAMRLVHDDIIDPTHRLADTLGV
jgi:hypothetical protein